jgi:hypothetical protein
MGYALLGKTGGHPDSTGQPHSSVKPGQDT